MALEKYEKDVLKTCLEVHMTYTGAYDRTVKEQQEDVDFLNMRLREWDNSSSANPNITWFDRTVKEMIRCVLWEAKCGLSD